MTYIRKIGTGTIGDKAEQLLAKEEIALATGFSLPERVMIGQDAFDHFWSNANDSASASQALTHLKHNASASTIYGDLNLNHPLLVVRSSAIGDATGIGIYDSVVVPNNVTAFVKGIGKVLSSYWSENAKAFRQQLNLPANAGIIVEPLVGDSFSNGTFFAPPLSGHGFTSRFGRPGYLAFTKGFGCAVDGQNCISLDEELLTEGDDKFGAALLQKQERAYYFGGAIELSENPFIKYHGGFDGHELYGQFISAKDGASKQAFVEASRELSQAVDNIKSKTLYTRLKQTETALGRPQYIEFAITLADGEKQYLIQIGDVRQPQSSNDAGTLDKVIFISNKDVGKGQLLSTSVAEAWNPDDSKLLREYNRHHKDYAVVFSSRLTTGARGDRDFISYSDISNANILLELTDGAHCSSSIGHFGGAIEESGKWFGRLSKEDHEKPDWNLWRASTEEKRSGGSNLRILSKPILTVAQGSKLYSGTLK